MGVIKNPYPRSTTSENNFMDTHLVINQVPIKLTQFCYNMNMLWAGIYSCSNNRLLSMLQLHTNECSHVSMHPLAILLIMALWALVSVLTLMTRYIYGPDTASAVLLIIRLLHKMLSTLLRAGSIARQLS